MSRDRSLFPAPVIAIERKSLPGTGAPVVAIIAVALLLVVIISAGWRRIDSSPVLMHLKSGEKILETRTVPSSDAYSVASDAQGWIFIEWGWAAILAATYSAGEWVGLSRLNVSLSALIIILLIIRARRRGARWFETVAISGFVMAALLPEFQLGPERAAAVLFLVALLLGEARKLWPLIFLPLIALLWANIHSAFLLTILVPFARMVIPPRTPQGEPASGPNGYLCVIILTCIGAMMINPSSIAISAAVFESAGYHLTETLQNIGELMASPLFWLKLCAALAMAFVIGFAPLRTQGWEWLTAVVLFLGTIISMRSLDFLLLYLSAPAASALTVLMLQSWNTRVVRYAASTALVLTVGVMIISSLTFARLDKSAFGTGIRSGIFPEAAASRLASLPLRNTILNDPDDSGYLIWRVWPNWKITMDSRPNLYDRELREQYDILWQGGQGWQQLLNHWRVKAVLGSPDWLETHPDNNLFRQLAKSDEWKAVYWDSDAILYLRQEVSLELSTLQEFRELRPGLSWQELSQQVSQPEQRRALAADLRRVLAEDPDNVLAAQFLEQAETLLTNR